MHVRDDVLHSYVKPPRTMLYSVEQFASRMSADEECAAPARDDLQQQLLDALLDGEQAQFRRLLAHPAVDAAHRYGKPHFATCLEIACRRRGRHAFVQELLARVKPNVNRVVPEPVHYAAGRGNDEALALLLRDKRTRLNAQDSSGHTALHFAARNFPEGADAPRYERCLQLLLAHPGVDANRANHKGFTALHEAVYSPAGRAAVLAMLQHAGSRPLDLDSARGHGRTARDAILEKFPDLEAVLPAATAPRSAQCSCFHEDSSLT